MKNLDMWRKVCQPRCKGGLGVRDIRLVNVSLLAKWWWRLLQDQSSLWKEVLEDIYGPRVSSRTMMVGRIGRLMLQDGGKI